MDLGEILLMGCAFGWWVFVGCPINSARASWATQAINAENPSVEVNVIFMRIYAIHVNIYQFLEVNV